MTDHSGQPLLYARIQSLQKKHEQLGCEIDAKQKCTMEVDFYLKQLKRRKLLLKDQIHALMDDLKQKSANAC